MYLVILMLSIIIYDKTINAPYYTIYTQAIFIHSHSDEENRKEKRPNNL